MIFGKDKLRMQEIELRLAGEQRANRSLVEAVSGLSGQLEELRDAFGQVSLTHSPATLWGIGRSSRSLRKSTGLSYYLVNGPTFGGHAARTENTPCPHCGGFHYFVDRRSGFGLSVRPSARCMTCGYTEAYTVHLTALDADPDAPSINCIQVADPNQLLEGVRMPIIPTKVDGNGSIVGIEDDGLGGLK